MLEVDAISLAYRKSLAVDNWWLGVVFWCTDARCWSIIQNTMFSRGTMTLAGIMALVVVVNLVSFSRIDRTLRARPHYKAVHAYSTGDIIEIGLNTKTASFKNGYSFYTTLAAEVPGSRYTIPASGNLLISEGRPLIRNHELNQRLLTFARAEATQPRSYSPAVDRLPLSDDTLEGVQVIKEPGNHWHTAWLLMMEDDEPGVQSRDFTVFLLDVSSRDFRILSQLEEGQIQGWLGDEHSHALVVVEDSLIDQSRGVHER